MRDLRRGNRVIEGRVGVLLIEERGEKKREAPCHPGFAKARE